MRVSCKTHALLQALQAASRAISGQQTLPILDNVLLEAEGKRCTVIATDLELSIITSFEANIENEGSITIPAKALLNFAQYNPDENILLETSEGTHLRCTSKHAKTTLSGEGASEYPTITPIEKKVAFSLEDIPLLKALHFVTFASARTTVRPVLSGVYVSGEKETLTFVATDSYRLSEYQLPTKGGEDISCIVPTKVLEELKTVIGVKQGRRPKDGAGGDEEAEEKRGGEKKKKTTPLTVTLGVQQVEFKSEHTHLLSRLIEGKFPNYTQIIPKDRATKVRFTTKDLTTTVKRMHYLAKETNNNLTFNLTKEHARISTSQTQLGKDEAVLPVYIEGRENTIALSSAYLLDLLARVDEEEVEMEVVDSVHPAVFRLPHEPSFLHLIMPLRLQEER